MACTHGLYNSERGYYVDGIVSQPRIASDPEPYLHQIFSNADLGGGLPHTRAS